MESVRQIAGRIFFIIFLLEETKDNRIDFKGAFRIFNGNFRKRVFSC